MQRPTTPPSTKPNLDNSVRCHTSELRPQRIRAHGRQPQHARPYRSGKEELKSSCRPDFARLLVQQRRDRGARQGTHVDQMIVIILTSRPLRAGT